LSIWSLPVVAGQEAMAVAVVALEVLGLELGMPLLLAPLTQLQLEAAVRVKLPMTQEEMLAQILFLGTHH
jgi:hypothetical protein